MQAASSSGDYDAPEEGGVMDLDALASLPPLDEALIPEAMGILGFDMADLPGGAEEMPGSSPATNLETRRTCSAQRVCGRPACTPAAPAPLSGAREEVS